MMTEKDAIKVRIKVLEDRKSAITDKIKQLKRELKTLDGKTIQETEDTDDKEDDNWEGAEELQEL